MKVWISLLLMFWVCMPVYAEDAELLSQELLSSYAELYGGLFEEGMEDLDEDNTLSIIAEGKDASTLLKELTKGETVLSPTEWIQKIFQLLFQEVCKTARSMTAILCLAILSAYLVQLRDGLQEKGVSQLAFFACYICIAIVAVGNFYEAAELVHQTVERIALFMQMLVPMVITSLMGCGAITSAAVFEPVLITVVEFAVICVQTFFIPLTMIGAGMNLINHLSERFRLEKLVKLMQMGVRWGMSLMLTVFVSVAGLQSITAGGADALTLKLGKFATANLVPMIGGILAESVETVMRCCSLIKNAVGVFGILCVVAIVAMPLIKIGAILILFRLTAAACEPVSDGKIVACLSDLANGISVLFSILAVLTVMFIIVLTIIIHAGSTMLMAGG